MIYFDNAATTYPKPEEVYIQSNRILREYGVNAGRGSYKLSKQAYEVIRETKRGLAEMVNCTDIESVVFTPSATIALNQIINGLKWDEHTVVYISPFEHNAIARPLHSLQRKYGFLIEMIPFKIKKEGNRNKVSFDEEEFKRKLSLNKPQYIIMSHVSNVIGYEIPIKLITYLGKKSNKNCIVVVDCAQSMGLIDIDIKELNIDYLVFAGHKTLYGILGVGGFIKNTSIELSEVITGGTGSDSLNLNMPLSGALRYEAGSKNIQAIGALLAAITWINNKGIKNIRTYENILAKSIITGLSKIQDVTIYISKNEDKQTGIIAFNLKGYTSEQLGQILDEDFNICVRTGYHCAPYIHDFLGTKMDQYNNSGVVRVSLSNFNSQNEINKFIDIVQELSEEMI